MLDIFDPNNWNLEARVCHIYGDTRASLFAEVDEIDYQWAIQWLWSHKWSRGKRKVYICRQLTERHGPEVRYNSTVMLHIEIMKRTGILPPSPAHTLVDHRDGKSLNCRRSNLRWATPSMNRKNIGGEYGTDLIED
jgi:hypothetical protein